MNRTSPTGLAARLLAFCAFAAASGGLAFAAMSAEGCTISSGNGDASDFSFDSGSSGNDGGTGTQGNPACNSCLFQGCSGQWAVCQQSTECISIYQCATKAGCDQNCVTQCFNDHPNGQKEYTALYTCDQSAACTSSCMSACNTPAASCPSGGQDGGGGTVDAAPPVLTCSDCTTQKCATENSKCAPDSDCDKYSQCVNACADLNCISGCGTTYAQGKTDSEALATCTSSSCKTECGL